MIELSKKDLAFWVVTIILSLLVSYQAGTHHQADDMIQVMQLKAQADANTLKCIDTLHDSVK